jgi:hypothetical protein
MDIVPGEVALAEIRIKLGISADDVPCQLRHLPCGYAQIRFRIAGRIRECGMFEANLAGPQREHAAECCFVSG